MPLPVAAGRDSALCLAETLQGPAVGGLLGGVAGEVRVGALPCAGMSLCGAPAL